MDQQKILKTGWEGLVKFIGTHKTENDVIKMMRENIENLTKKQTDYRQFLNLYHPQSSEKCHTERQKPQEK